jgi:hypothetical protein
MTGDALYIMRLFLRQSGPAAMKCWQKRSGSDAAAADRSGCAAIGAEPGAISSAAIGSKASRRIVLSLAYRYVILLHWRRGCNG